MSDEAAPLSEKLRQIAASIDGVMGYSVHHLQRGDIVEYRADERFPTASTIKVPTLVVALEANQAGEIGYYDTMTYEEKYTYGGAGLLQNYQLGRKLELKELLFLMMGISDNTATLMVMDWLGMERINQRMEEIGLPNTRILSRLQHPSDETRRLNGIYGWGMTTPGEMRLLMQWIATGKAGTPAATDEMQRIMRREYFDDPAVVQHPPSVVVLHKGGAVEASRSSVYFVYSPSGPYVVAVYTRENTDQRWTRDNEAERAIGRLAGAIWRHYHPEHAWRPPEGIEAF